MSERVFQMSEAQAEMLNELTAMLHAAERQMHKKSTELAQRLDSLRTRAGDLADEAVHYGARARNATLSDFAAAQQAAQRAVREFELAKRDLETTRATHAAVHEKLVIPL